MQKINVNPNLVTGEVMQTGRPTIPVTGRQPQAERKMSDPSSSLPRGERYPIPSFFEYRIRAREHDPL
jgi:hypothetical protein